MAATYEPIATTTLGSAASSITFSSISSAYTDLRLVIVPTSSTGNMNGWLRFNSDTGTNYSITDLTGNGSAAASGRATSQTKFDFHYNTGSIGTTPTLFEIDIFSYAGSTYKTLLCKNSNDRNGSGSVAAIVGLWRSTSAINAVSFTANGDTFAVGTTATLYGIKAA